MTFDSYQQIAFKEFPMPFSDFFFNLIPQCIHHVPKDVVDTKYTQKDACSSKGFLVSLADFEYSFSIEIKNKKAGVDFKMFTSWNCLSTKDHSDFQRLVTSFAARIPDKGGGADFIWHVQGTRCVHNFPFHINNFNSSPVTFSVWEGGEGTASLGKS